MSLWQGIEYSSKTYKKAVKPGLRPADLGPKIPTYKGESRDVYELAKTEKQCNLAYTYLQPYNIDRVPDEGLRGKLIEGVPEKKDGPVKVIEYEK